MTYEEYEEHKMKVEDEKLGELKLDPDLQAAQDPRIQAYLNELPREPNTDKAR